LQHHIGNELAVTVGYSEMLRDDPRLPPDAHAQAEKVMTSARAAAAVVHKLNKQLARMELERGVAGPEVLDVDHDSTLQPGAEQHPD
jgi:hypothetical protein